MEPDVARQLLADLQGLDAKPPEALKAGATDAELQSHALHCDAVSHVLNAIDALKRSIASRN